MNRILLFMSESVAVQVVVNNVKGVATFFRKPGGIVDL